MSVYCRETARNLETAVKSMLEQTVPPDELVLVCDGPLTDELNSVIDHISKDSPDTLKVVRLSENIGLGRALQTGLKHASNELIARMDSDDISCPDRCEKQLLFMKKHPGISILGGTIAEFEEKKKKIRRARKRSWPFRDHAIPSTTLLSCIAKKMSWKRADIFICLTWRTIIYGSECSCMGPEDII